MNHEYSTACVLRCISTFPFSTLPNVQDHSFIAHSTQKEWLYSVERSNRTVVSSRMGRRTCQFVLPFLRSLCPPVLGVGRISAASLASEKQLLWPRPKIRFIGFYLFYTLERRGWCMFTSTRLSVGLSV